MDLILIAQAGVESLVPTPFEAIVTAVIAAVTWWLGRIGFSPKQVRIIRALITTINRLSEGVSDDTDTTKKVARLGVESQVGEKELAKVEKKVKAKVGD